MKHRNFVVKLFPWVGLTVLMSVAVLMIFAQPAPGPKRGIATQVFDGKTISINYGRPSLMGRDLNTAAKVGTVWRFGMNEATVLKSDFDLYTCCGVIKAGSYSLWAKKVGDNKWEMIFNSQTGQWGTEHNPTKDLISVPMTVESSNQSVEKFTVTIVKTAKGGQIRGAWGKQVLVMDFSSKA